MKRLAGPDLLEIYLEFCYDSDREPSPSREISKRCLCKSEYDKKTDVICDSCGNNQIAKN